MKRRSKAQWLKLFAEQDSSGMTITAFCDEQGICSKYFGLRRKQLREKTVTPKTPSFVPVSLTGKSHTMMVELHLSGALQIRIPTSVAPHWLAELVQHLRGLSYADVC